MTVTIRHGDCREVLRTLPDESVHCCVTSPPYFGLRDYGVSGQIGLEATPDDFVEQMVAVFREVRRVLRKDGTLWLNLGDSYAGSGRGGGSEGSKQRTNAGSLIPPTNRGSTLSAGFHETARQNGVIGRAWVKPPPGYKQKDLIGIPWMTAFALRADGWYLRKSIIWHKPNPMPENVTDRPTSSHENIFLMAKSRIYYYDAEAVKEEAVSDHPSGNGFKREARLTYQNSFGEGRGNSMQWQITEHRNMRDVWTVPVKPFNEAHFATFPPELIEPCVKAGCPAGGTVIDPFGGAGTTGLVADRLGRSAILIELNPEYAAIAERRIRGDAGMFAEVER